MRLAGSLPLLWSQRESRHSVSQRCSGRASFLWLAWTEVQFWDVVRPWGQFWRVKTLLPQFHRKHLHRYGGQSRHVPRIDLRNKDACGCLDRCLEFRFGAYHEVMIFVACLWCFAVPELAFLCIFVGLQQECDLISGFGWRHWTKRPWRWQETVSRQVQCLVIWSFSCLFPSFRSVFPIVESVLVRSAHAGFLTAADSVLQSIRPAIRPTSNQLNLLNPEMGENVAPQGSASSLGIFLIGYWSQFGSQYCMPGDSFVVRWDDEVVTKRQLWYSVGVGSNPWIHGIFKRIFLVKNCGKAKEFTTLISSVCCLCTLPMCLVYELWDLTIGCRCSLHRFKGCSCCFGSQLYHREFLRHGCSLCSWVCWRSFQVSHSESLNWTSTVHFFWIGSYAIDYRCDGEFNCTANIK